MEWSQLLLVKLAWYRFLLHRGEFKDSVTESTRSCDE